MFVYYFQPWYYPWETFFFFFNIIPLVHIQNRGLLITSSLQTFPTQTASGRTLGHDVLALAPEFQSLELDHFIYLYLARPILGGYPRWDALPELFHRASFKWSLRKRGFSTCLSPNTPTSHMWGNNNNNNLQLCCQSCSLPFSQAQTGLSHCKLKT